MEPFEQFVKNVDVLCEKLKDGKLSKDSTIVGFFLCPTIEFVNGHDKELVSIIYDKDFHETILINIDEINSLPSGLRYLCIWAYAYAVGGQKKEKCDKTAFKYINKEDYDVFIPWLLSKQYRNTYSGRSQSVKKICVQKYPECIEKYPAYF